MSIKPVTYYEVDCDYPDCEVKTGTLGLGEYAAWGDKDQALDSWTDFEGWHNETTGETFCFHHRPALCVECDALATDKDADDEDVCDEHRPAAVAP